MKITPLSTACCLLLASRLAAQDATNPRPELDGLASALDTAIRRVSLPSVEPLLGAERARGYYVAGFGAMFVVPSRSIPRDTHLLVLRRGNAPALGGMPDELPDYAELEAILGAADARRLLEQRRLEEEARREVARTARTRRLQSRDQELRALEARAEQFQREAEQLRQEAERQLEQVLSEVQRRIDPSAPPSDARRDSAAPSAAGPGPATRPPAGGVVSAGVGPAATAGTASPGRDSLPPPPWRFWFATDNPEDDRSPARIVSDVREAVTATLETYGPNLRTLGNDELVTVAVDFVPRGLFTTNARAARTLVVRVRKKALDERAAGRLSSDEFKRRIEINEY